MPRIKIDKLPEGFIIRDGKIVQGKAHGGSTGDQYDYHLTTVPTNLIGDQVNKDGDRSVRYSLGSVPREEANLEAEGGETVLTDLNNDGQFGLYNINGPSHDDGGVPMRLPGQSFIYSRDPAMEIDPDTLHDAFGIKSSKPMNPAQVSKKFQLNNYNVQLTNSNSDNIQRDTAELMLDKNKMELSKLAFVQESSKNFTEGVPLAAFPYIQSQGQDPIQFKQQVEKISREQAQQEALNQLPPEDRQKIMNEAAFMMEMQKAEQMRQAQAQMEAGMQQNILTQPEGAERPSPVNPVADMQFGGSLQDFFSQIEGGNSHAFSSNPQLMFAYDDQFPAGRSDESYLNQRMKELYSQMQPRQQATPMMQVGGDVIDNEYPEFAGFPETSAPITNKMQTVYGGTIEPEYTRANRTIEPNTIEPNFESLAKAIAKGDVEKEREILNYLSDEKNKKEIFDFLKSEPGVKELEDFVIKGAASAQDAVVIKPDAEEVEATEESVSDGSIEESENPQEAEVEGVQDTESAEVPMDSYEMLEKLFKSDSPQWQDITNKIYAAFKANMSASGISDADIPDKEAMIDIVLKEQKAQKALTQNAPFEEIHDNSRFDGPSNVNNAEAQKLFDKYELGYNIDELETKLIQGFFEAVDFYASDYVSVTGTGPDEPENYEDNPALSSIDGVAGDNYINTTLNVVKLPEEPIIEEEEEEEEEVISIEPGDVGETRELGDPEMWKQDLLRLHSIAGRRRRLGLPFEPAVETDEYRYVLADPTREIAALNEVKNIQDQAIASFAPAQSFLARTAKTTGDTMARIADTVSKYQTSNVDIVNQGQLKNTSLRAANRKERRDRAKTLYDNTELALQNFMDERNFDREQYISAYSDAITNMMNTYNLNSLYDLYNIDPASGGMIEFTDGKDLLATQERDNQAAQREDMRSALAELYNSVPEGSTIPAAVINQYLGIEGSTNDEQALTNLEMAKQQYQADPRLTYQQRYGGAPFFAGMTGV